MATGFGAGLSPRAPGTLGSVEGVLLYLVIAFLAIGPSRQSPAGSIIFLLVTNLLVFGAGVWAANIVCRQTGLGDPQKVVVDEVSGQLIALSPLMSSPSIIGVIAAFVLFRLFDILKPYPISRLERLHGGLGVMADDALAGVFAGILVWLGRSASLL